jgi:hypothetical protein
MQSPIVEILKMAAERGRELRLAEEVQEEDPEPP